VLRDWWNAQDVAAFTALGDKLVAQYDQFEPLPGLRLNGRLGLGENIGDNGGLQVAYHAYRLSLNGAEAPTLDGMTGDQRFFLSWGQIWRTLFREQRLRNQVLTGPHSPPEFRTNGVVRNMDAWYAAFDVQPGQAMYLPPEQRVQIW
jgi:predicted metalloendopeptidase